MDLSKLPKLSDSPPPPPPANPPPSPETPRPAPVRSVPPYSMAELWISVGIGVIVLLIFPNTLKYTVARLTGQTPAIYPDATKPPPAMADFILYTDGTKVFYRDTTMFWSDLVLTAFGLVLILDGIIPAITRRRSVLTALLALTLLTTFGNLYYLFATFNQGLAIWSALAVVIGGYLSMLQWQRLGYGPPNPNDPPPAQA